MNPRPAVLLYPVALAGIAAGLFYVIRSTRRRDALLSEIRRTVDQSAVRSHVTNRLLKKQRSAIHSLCEYLLPVTKGVENPTS